MLHTVNGVGVVAIVTRYGLDDRGVRVRVPVWSEYSLLHIVRTGSGAHQPPIQWVPGAISPAGKAAGA
jgi:hypothetical protein